MLVERDLCRAWLVVVINWLADQASRRVNARDEPRRAGVSSRADGSTALLGSPSTTRPALTLSRFWRYLKSATRLMFVLADGRGDAIGIEAMGPPDSLPELVEILDD